VPFNFRLNLQSVFRQLGIQTGARLPQLNEEVQMTMLITDLSRLVPAPVEPRGLAGVNLSGSLGLFSVCQLHSLAAGGIFVENVLFRSEGFPSSEDYLFEVDLADRGMPLAAQVDVGGDPTRSIFTADEVVQATTGVPVPATSGNQNFGFPSGIFVPNQSFFTVGNLTKNKRLDVAILYRELPAVEEVG